jgi:exodeoxyribonuclease-3
MHIVSWNCHHGEARSACARLERLLPFVPDIIVLQECAKPAVQGSDCLWFGENPLKGVGILVREGWTVEKLAQHPGCPDSVYPVKVSGKENFNLFAVWAQLRPSYTEALLDAVKTYQSLLDSAPSIVIGDFNSHTRCDRKGCRVTHAILVQELKTNFGLVSAFHHAASRDGRNEETPTYFHWWNQEYPFHIDYCFLPGDWTNRIGTVAVGDYATWSAESDHRPLSVEITSDPSSVVEPLHDDEREKKERIARYSSPEFAWQLLDHMHKAVDAALLEAQEKR